jgi:hypothetical protein
MTNKRTILTESKRRRVAEEFPSERGDEYMVRLSLLVCSVALITTAPVAAQSRSSVTQSAQPTFPAAANGNNREFTFSAPLTELPLNREQPEIIRGCSKSRPCQRITAKIVRWGEVGRCVAAADRSSSLAYVSNKKGSAESLAAARNLDPIFSTCLSGADVPKKNDMAVRRAAVADALGIGVAG